MHTLESLGMKPNDNITKRLLFIRKSKGIIAIICNKEEAKKLFSLNFPYKVNDLSGHPSWKNKYKYSGFIFYSPGNSYASRNYFNESEFKCISYKEFTKTELYNIY